MAKYQAQSNARECLYVLLAPMGIGQEGILDRCRVVNALAFVYDAISVPTLVEGVINALTLVGGCDSCIYPRAGCDGSGCLRGGCD